MSLTRAQFRALRGLRDHDDVGAHFHGLSERGGLASATIPALLRRGLIEDVDGRGLVLTDAGRAVIEAPTRR